MPENKSNYKTYEELIEFIESNNLNYDLKLINKAYMFANQAHIGQNRHSGEPYILHPVSVAYILVELGMDTETILAGLLHDVVEDTEISIEEIAKQFGNDIALLVNGVTNLKKIKYLTSEEQQAVNIRKMLISMAKDIRVIIIKLADRLHNMRTIDCMPKHKKLLKSLENMEVFVPIAHRLGINKIKEELEDMSIKILDPIGYKQIEASLALQRDDRKKFIHNIKKCVRSEVSKQIDNFYVEGRVKSISGIYKKAFIKGRLLAEIYDVYAIRVIVNSVWECYHVLGIVHDLFQPIPNRFKDYISIPKPNMYQSLHTTVIGGEGIPFEIQIRTFQMHRTAEYGIAAHWKYKLGIKGENKEFRDNLEKHVLWIRQMVEGQKDDQDALIDVVRNIKFDLVPDEIYAFTPKGKIITLPFGATVIDFAYAIHSQVGNKMIGAKVNKRIVPIDHVIQTGEIIEIITTHDQNKGPSRPWLSIVKTSGARNKIKQWFRKERREENIIEGHAIVEREFKKHGILLNEAEIIDFLSTSFKKYQCSNLEDFYALVGCGDIQLVKVMHRLKKRYLELKNDKILMADNNLQSNKGTNINATVQMNSKKTNSGIIVDGMNNCLVRFSNCCKPIPGDEIIGFVTVGYGVSIHRRFCKNVPKDLNNVYGFSKWVDVRWEKSFDFNKLFEFDIKIKTSNNESTLPQLIQKLSTLDVKIVSLKYKASGVINIVYLTILVKNLYDATKLMNKIRMFKNIISIKRRN